MANGYQKRGHLPAPLKLRAAEWIRAHADALENVGFPECANRINASGVLGDHQCSPSNARLACQMADVELRVAKFKPIPARYPSTTGSLADLESRIARIEKALKEQLGMST